MDTHPASIARRLAKASPLLALLALALLLLGACGDRAEPTWTQGLALAKSDAATDGRQPLPAAAAPATSPLLAMLDAAQGVLSLPGVAVGTGAARACYDARLGVVSLAPVQLVLQTAVPQACDAAASNAGFYDGAGKLTLPALVVRTAGVADSCYDATLRALPGPALSFELIESVPSACPSAAAVGAASTAFRGTVILGQPTARSIALSVHAPDQSGQLRVSYGLTPALLTHQLAARRLSAGEPLTLVLDGLLADTAYAYRLEFQPDGAGAFQPGATQAFHTARPAGARFTFTMQADSHLDENSDLAVYRTTLANVRADLPDFHIDLGDTFMTEKHAEPLSATSPPAAAASLVDARYVYERANFALAASTVPLFLVNGNHDGELGWLANGTAQSLAVWTSLARRRYYLNPEPGMFYSGDSLQELFVGERASWYAWQWGDALFVALDPYWSSARNTGADAWNLTLGERQYRWLADTLARSTARWKFVFVHNLVGGLDGQMRGGVEAAPFYEWGGRNADGSSGFASRRPGWALPIHALLVKHGVTAVFHGHDHLYARQDLDGVVYQAVPQPSAKNSTSGANLARDYHYNAGVIDSSSGHLRVTVSPDAVTTEYVRAWLPTQENAQRRNGQVSQRWTIPARAGAARIGGGAPPVAWAPLHAAQPAP